MTSINLTPYIYFKGACREAMEFYKNVFGGELTTQTYAEANMGEDESVNDWIMHARLQSQDFALMGSDAKEASPEAKKIELTLEGDDDGKLRKIFEDLSAGGTVEQPLEKQFWGDIFGKLKDKYGVIWMFNISSGGDKN